MKRLILSLAVLAVAAVAPALAGAATLRGVVVAKQGARVLVASPSGVVRSYAGHVAIGSRVSVAGGRLTVVGHATTAHLRGVVVRRVGGTLFLSSNTHLVAVHGRGLADSAPPSSTTTTPVPGDVVSTQVAIGANGQLDEQQESDLGPSQSGSIQVQAVVAAVGAGTVTLTVEGQTLTVTLPGGLTLPASVVGQTVTISLDVAGQNGSQGDGGNSNGGANGGSGGSGGNDGGGGDN
ncbi:MAG: hypothetical protein ACYDCH_14900 [Gaiellaceae bacterium]